MISGVPMEVQSKNINTKYLIWKIGNCNRVFFSFFAYRSLTTSLSKRKGKLQFIISTETGSIIFHVMSIQFVFLSLKKTCCTAAFNVISYGLLSSFLYSLEHCICRHCNELKYDIHLTINKANGGTCLQRHLNDTIGKNNQLPVSYQVQKE